MDSLALANTKINLDKEFNNFFRDEYVVVQKKKTGSKLHNQQSEWNNCFD
ncbi:hypothetical protein D6255_RS13005 [Enterococcus hirae]